MSSPLPSPFTNQPAPLRVGVVASSAAEGGSPHTPSSSPTRGRKPRRGRGATHASLPGTTISNLPDSPSTAPPTFTPLQWTVVTNPGTMAPTTNNPTQPMPVSSGSLLSGTGYGPSSHSQNASPMIPTLTPGSTTTFSIPMNANLNRADQGSMSSANTMAVPRPGVISNQPTFRVPAQRMEEEETPEDEELLPAMADDDYSAQLSFQTQSKDNLKVLMENLSQEQYERFEAYRRNALNKASVRKLIQQTLGQQVSQPVAQVVAGFAKVFVGEIVEHARAVQEKRGDRGPLSPDHLREAYRAYQLESGRVGAARPIRSKKLFVR